MKALKSFLFPAFASVILIASVSWVLRGEENRLFDFARNTVRTIADGFGGRTPQTADPAGADPSSSGQADDIGGVLGEVLGKAGDVLADKNGKPADPSAGNAAKDPIGELFKVGHRIAKTGDDMAQQIMGLTDAEEVAIGRDVYEIMRQNHPIANDPIAVARIQRIAASVLQKRSRKNIDFTFSVIEEPELNAFAHLGGYVYVYRGLLDAIHSDAELEFVLAHEIGHVDLGHCKGQMTYVARAESVGGEFGGNLAGLAYRALATGHTKDHEFGADAFAYQTMRKMGQSHNESTALLRLLAKKYPEAKPEAVDSDPMSQTMDAISQHFATHPPIRERIRRLDGMR